MPKNKSSNSDRNEILLSISRSLKELVLLNKLKDYELIRKHLQAVFDTDEKIRIFELSDGENTVRDISKVVGMSIRTISTYWQDWNSKGFMETKSARGGGKKYIKLFSLKKFSIEPAKPVNGEEHG